MFELILHRNIYICIYIYIYIYIYYIYIYTIIALTLYLPMAGHDIPYATSPKPTDKNNGKYQNVVS